MHKTSQQPQRLLSLPYPRDSVLLRHLFASASYSNKGIPQKLNPPASVATGMLVIGSLALLTLFLFLFTLFTPQYSLQEFFPKNAHPIASMPFLTPLIGMLLVAIAFTFLQRFFVLQRSAHFPLSILGAFVFLFSISALPYPATLALFLPLSYLWALCLFLFDPSLHSFSSFSKKAQQWIFFLLCITPSIFLLLVPFLLPQYSDTPFSGLHLFFSALSSLFTWLTHNAYRTFTYYVFALNAYVKPQQENSSALLMSITLLLFFPLWIFDGKGLLLTGGHSSS